MNWPASNSYLHVRTWLEANLTSAEDAREGANVVRMLLEWYTQRSRAQLIANGFLFSESDLNALKAHLLELNTERPIQQIIGESEFFGRPFTVDSAVLIPRPETEELVSQALQRLQTGQSVLDIGTGSGCIAITLALEVPGLAVEAWDVSADALCIALENQERYEAVVDFVCCDVFTAVPEGRFDAILSNPPYITISEKESMARRVTAFEPYLALFVEDDPLVFYRVIVDRAQIWLKEKGFLAFECHVLYAQQVAELCQRAGFQAEVLTDQQGKERMVFATR
jgi:release factor glutamine methyltransferase